MRIATSTRMTVSIALVAGVGIGLVGLADRSEPPPPEPTAMTVDASSPGFVSDDVKRRAAVVKRTLDLLCGTRPAQLGPMFDGVELGRLVDRLPDVRTPPTLDAKVELLTTGRRVD